MDTLAFVKHCRETIERINELSTDKFIDKEGYTNYDEYQHELDGVTQDVQHLIDVNTNPTLPTYERMLQAAESKGLL